MKDNQLLTVAIDAVRGKLGDYSKNQTSEGIRNALIELNGGSTKLDFRNFYRGSALFSLVEELIPVIVDEGIKDDNILLKLVEYRNIADGDENSFYVEGPANFVVADTAKGIQGVRRQRLTGGESVSVNMSMKFVRVYEDINRLLAGKITFDQLVNGVANSFKKQINMDAATAIQAITEQTMGLSATTIKTGTFNEDDLTAIIAHVEAATGKTASIYGTKAGLRKVKTAEVSDAAKNDAYNLGYYGKFYGTDMMEVRQAHKPGTEVFALNDNRIYILATDDKPIKMVNEGSGIMAQREFTDNADLTQEYI